jgi:hypothetical protein
MNFAAQKLKLYKIVTEADEETTAKLIDFAQKLDQAKYLFTNEELAEFNRRRDEYLKNPDSGISWEESLSRVRNKLKK